MFYIDTDADKIAFIDWYVKKVDTVKSLFDQTRIRPDPAQATAFGSWAILPVKR